MSPRSYAGMLTGAGRLLPRGAAALIFGVCLTAAWRACLSAPYADAHRWAADVFEIAERGRWLTYVWLDHAHQRIPLIRLIQATDLRGGGGGHVFLFVSVAFMAFGLAAVLRLVLASVDRGPARSLLAALVAILLFNATTAEDFAYPVFSVYPLVAGAVMVSCAAFVESAGRPPAGFLGALLAALVASAGNAAGLVIWPVLIFWAHVRRRPVRQVITLWVLGALVIGAFQYGLAASSTSREAEILSADRLLKMIRYVLRFAGLWWDSLIAPGRREVAGAVVLTLSLAALLLPLVPGRRSGKVEQLGLMLISFGLAAAALATIGRVDELPDPVVPTRYYPLAAMLSVGIVLVFTPVLTRRVPEDPQVGTLLMGLLALASVGLLVSEIRGARRLNATADQIRRGSDAFDAGDRSPQVIRFVQPNVEEAVRVRAELRRRGLPY